MLTRKNFLAMALSAIGCAILSACDGDGKIDGEKLRDGLNEVASDDTKLVSTLAASDDDHDPEDLVFPITGSLFNDDAVDPCYETRFAYEVDCPNEGHALNRFSAAGFDGEVMTWCNEDGTWFGKDVIDWDNCDEDVSHPIYETAYESPDGTKWRVYLLEESKFNAVNQTQLESGETPVTYVRGAYGVWAGEPYEMVSYNFRSNEFVCVELKDEYANLVIVGEDGGAYDDFNAETLDSIAQGGL